MHTTSLLRLLALATTAASLATTSLAQSEVIYRELFGRNTTTGVSLSNFGWSVYSGAAAAEQSPSAALFNVLGEATPTNFTNITGAAAVNSIFAPNNVFTSTTNGRTFFGGTGIFIAYTNEHDIDRSLWNVNSFSWDQRADNPALGVVIQIDESSWYVSSLAPAGPGGSTWNTTEAGMAKIDFATTTWSTLNFTSGNTLSIGAAATLTGSKITAFGVYRASGSASARIDGFTVTATPIPEPSSVAALAGAVGLGAATLRRRGPASRR